MIFVILWRILCNTLSLLTSIDAVPVIPPIILYLQSVTFTCAVNTLPAAVCRVLCIVAVIVPLAAPYISVSLSLQLNADVLSFYYPIHVFIRNI